MLKPIHWSRLSKLTRVTVCVAAGLVTLWVAGFFIFFAIAATSIADQPDQNSDVIVVLTGGTGRIEEAFTLMAGKRAKAMLITGVHPDVTLKSLVDLWDAPADKKNILKNHCCIFVEHAALSTEDNATETREWLGRNGGASGVRVRLVTSDYHMPRSKILFHHFLPDIILLAWPVKSASFMSAAFWHNIFVEYTKTLLTWIS